MHFACPPQGYCRRALCVSVKNMDLSIIIPMFNEAENVEITLKRVEEVLAQFSGSFEIIPVNDGSVDNTLEILKKVAERDEKIKVASYPKNIGRGMALRTGFKNSNGDIIVSIDADLSFSPSHILDLIKVLKDESDIDFVLASPYVPGGRTENVPFSSPMDQQNREQSTSIHHAEPYSLFNGGFPCLSEKSHRLPGTRIG